MNAKTENARDVFNAWQESNPLSMFIVPQFMGAVAQATGEALETAGYDPDYVMQGTPFGELDVLDDFIQADFDAGNLTKETFIRLLEEDGVSGNPNAKAFIKRVQEWAVEKVQSMGIQPA